MPTVECVQHRGTGWRVASGGFIDTFSAFSLARRLLAGNKIGMGTTRSSTVGWTSENDVELKLAMTPNRLYNSRLVVK
jgi:hypothetical protein